MIPALAAALGPLLQAAGLSGASGAAVTAGASAAGGTAASAGGMAGIGRVLAGMMGGGGRAAALGSTQEIGATVQQIADLTQMVSAAQGAMKDIGGEVRSINDPNGPQMPRDDAQNRLGELMRQRQERAAEIEQHRNQIHDMQARIDATLQPPEAPMPGGHKALQVGGAAMAASQFLPGLLKNLPGIAAMVNIPQAGMNAASSVGMNQTDRAVAGSMAGFGMEGAKTALNPMAVMRGDLHLHMAKLPGLLQEWGEGLVESKRHLMVFSGSLQAAFRQEEVRTIGRNIESAKATGGATAGLSDALQDLYDEVRPIKDVVTVVLSRGVEAGVRSLTLVVSMLQTIVSVVPGLSRMTAAVIDWLDGDTDPKGSVPLLDFMATASKVRETLRRNRPRPGR